MNVRNCPRCGKIFVPNFSNVCGTCQKEEEGEFTKVKDYLYQNPGASIQEVSEATEVPTERILKYLREGRLQLTSHDNLILSCESCDKPILTGRFCESCTSKMANELGKFSKGQEKSKSDEGRSRMYTADLRKK